MLRLTLSDDAPRVCGRKPRSFCCEKYSDNPLRHTRAFFRPLCYEFSPVIYMALLDTLLFIILLAFIIWFVFLHKAYTSQAHWSYKDADYANWLLLPSFWLALSALLMLGIRIYLMTEHRENQHNPYPAKEPKPDHPRLLLLLWNLMIVQQTFSFLMFIYAMHSLRYNEHIDVAEIAFIIVVWIVNVLDLLFRATPVHWRDILLNVIILMLVIAYLALLSLAFNQNLYKEYNFRDKSIGHNLLVLVSVFTAVQVFLVSFVKIRNKLFKVYVYFEATKPDLPIARQDEPIIPSEQA